MFHRHGNRFVRVAAFVAAATAAVTAVPQAAFAYQTVKVGPSGATVFANPQSDSPTTGTLRAGQTINIGDQPKGGYYRATAAGGVTGWVQEDALLLPTGRTHQANHVNASAEPHVGSGGEAEATKFSVGALAGLGFAGGGSGLAFGVDGGYKLSREWGLGVYFEYMSLASASATATGGASLMMFAAELNYFLPQLEGLHLGAKLGYGIASASATGSSTVNGVTTPVTVSASSAAIGGAAAVGYDYRLMPMLSIGAEANFFVISGGVSSTLIDVLASVKYNF